MRANPPQPAPGALVVAGSVTQTPRTSAAPGSARTDAEGSRGERSQAAAAPSARSATAHQTATAASGCAGSAGARRRRPGGGPTQRERREPLQVRVCVEGGG
eukprot:360766-Chlamydomonas_euryale.AAC.18